MVRLVTRGVSSMVRLVTQSQLGAGASTVNHGGTDAISKQLSLHPSEFCSKRSADDSALPRSDERKLVFYFVALAGSDFVADDCAVERADGGANGTSERCADAGTEFGSVSGTERSADDGDAFA